MKISPGSNLLVHRPPLFHVNEFTLLAKLFLTASCIGFVRSDWIGCGKTWVENRMPEYVSEARETSREVPIPALTACIPPNSYPVASLLAEFPSPAHTAILATYSPDTPNTLQPGLNELDFLDAVTLIRQSPVPTNISQLRTGYSDAWLGGNLSIRVSHLPDLRFPLWTEALLARLAQVNAKRTTWDAAHQWLQMLVAGPVNILHELAAKSLRRMLSMPWDERVPGQLDHAIMRSGDLTRLLGQEWLDDEVINGASSWITRQETLRANAPSTIILSTHFYDHLARRFEDPDLPFQNRRRTTTEMQIMEGNVDIIFIPTNRSNLHWLLVEIDVRNRTIFTRDSLSSHTLLPIDMRNLLIDWLAILFPGELWAVESHMLPRQQDGHSCGLVVITEMAHIALGLSQWSFNTAVMTRLEWYLRLTELYDIEDGSDDFENVSTPSVRYDPLRC